jgi:hypothetical protein
VIGSGSLLSLRILTTTIASTFAVWKRPAGDCECKVCRWRHVLLRPGPDHVPNAMTAATQSGGSVMPSSEERAPQMDALLLVEVGSRRLTEAPQRPLHRARGKQAEPPLVGSARMLDLGARQEGAQRNEVKIFDLRGCRAGVTVRRPRPTPPRGCASYSRVTDNRSGRRRAARAAG